ncbi:Na/Pi cotransporter family protein [uncultured Ruminococcus sp.]|uniref:Na/Pi cotransporter family protein n=1 Tax=uncultured Ruminococcus sp. TaxID=165186 RepID=UPI002631C257|nr:Na/Pi cotransporter family protein [uncultured Ruminococcus sp.]
MEEFSIFNIFTLLGGLAFFLYGMKVMSTGLEKLTGGKLEVALKKMTENKIKAILLGMGVTVAIQSSSAMTVMLVGFVNSGIMTLEQTIGVCFGSNIGTTFTAWILCLDGIEDNGSGGILSFILKMLKPVSFSPLIALAGVILIMFAKKNKKKDVGRILVGFAVLMTGMTFMSDSVDPLANSPDFQRILTAFHNPVLGVAVGTIFTGIIQSSAGSIGILQAFSKTGGLTYGMALPIIMGCNIGTCVTALLSTVGVSKDAKRVAWTHIIIKIIGTLVLLPIIMILQNVMNLSIMSKTVGYVGIAVMHTIFNVATTVMFMPFTKQLVKLSKIVVRDGKEEKVDSRRTLTGLDDILLKTPAVAVQTCLTATEQMAELTRETIDMALKLLVDYDSDKCDLVIENEDIIDGFEDKINSYLIKIAKASVTGKDSRSVSKMMHCVGNFERISDHAVNLVESAQEMHEKGIMFSEECINEITVITDAISENINKAFDSYMKNDLAIAHKVEPLEEVVDNLSTELKNRHIRRLQNDECTVELGYIFQDVLTNLERISDHCSNIAGCLIETDEKTNLHAYLHDVKENDEQFRNEYREYAEEYFRRLDSVEVKTEA